MNKARLIIIGLDGGTFKIIDPLLEQGKLPNFRRLIKRGAKGVLKSTIPPLTAPAWVTLMTGVNPGKHGLFDFKKLDKITYCVPVNPNTTDTYNVLHSQYYRGKTVWDILGRAGLKVSALMMPMTYPAWPVNGYMLAGFPSPDFMKLNGYPQEWATGLGPLFDIAISINDKDKMVRECHKLNAGLSDIFIQQLKADECDCLCVVFSSTDFLQHYLWKHQGKKGDKYAESIANMYMEADGCLGQAMELADKENCSFMILSDHGFTASPRTYFHTNAWLASEGYLSSKQKGIAGRAFDLLLNPLRYQKVALRLLLKGYFKYLPKGIQKKMSGSYYATNRFIWPQTKAFRYKIGTAEGIVINLKDSQSCGIVEKADYETLRTEIIDKLKKLRDPKNGAAVVSEVYRREEACSGKFLDLVPDIIFLLHDEYKGGVGIDKAKITEGIPCESVETISGVHDMDGILILSGKNFKENSRIPPVQMTDIFPTILYDLGLPIPEYVDGAVIKEALKNEDVRLPAVDKKDAAYEENTYSKLSDSEEEAIKKSLKGLGYL